MTLGAVLFLGILESRAEEPTIDPALEARGWNVLTFSGIPSNQYRLDKEGAIEVRGENAAGILYRPVDGAKADETCLRWRWRVDRSPPPTDLSRKKTDDRPVAVYVGFAYASEQASFWERLVRLWVEVTHGADAPGRVLAYTWGGLTPRGSEVRSPHLRDAGKIVILRSGAAPLGIWFDEQVDLAQDYQRVFGAPATRVVDIGLVADSDDSRTRSLARIADLSFASDCHATETMPTDQSQRE